MDLMQEARGANLREQVVERVRSEIVSGRTPAGTVYSVPSLAAALGMSTTPVREALLELCRNGLLTPMRNRGFRVQAMTLEELDNLFTMRELLERFAIESLARQGLKDPGPARAMADVVAKAVDDGDIQAYIAGDRAFHEILAAEVGNPLQTKLILQLRDDMRLFGVDSEEGLQRQHESVKEHYQIIDLAIRQDVEAIGPLISRHILSWKPLFRSALAQTV
ncbi:GntR family transcriptional regulator [Comamonas sp. BIGb0124]|uniref:GntR family transcriptional regulator n=1 Tax=Comamonas sp. BIGb0124 TaxID=2485130 RepID=UPI000F48148E|nr:GntR family transcriptional regulator [Comamonas sp. BIGb0124]ROR26580.1 GntR family transcriptional regulator [Comamonas sp. BIGb0124]